MLLPRAALLRHLSGDRRMTPLLGPPSVSGRRFSAASQGYQRPLRIGRSRLSAHRSGGLGTLGHGWATFWKRPPPIRDPGVVRGAAGVTAPPSRARGAEPVTFPVMSTAPENPMKVLIYSDDADTRAQIRLA